MHSKQKLVCQWSAPADQAISTQAFLSSANHYAAAALHLQLSFLCLAIVFPSGDSFVLCRKFPQSFASPIVALYN